MLLPVFLPVGGGRKEVISIDDERNEMHLHKYTNAAALLKL